MAPNLTQPEEIEHVLREMAEHDDIPECSEMKNISSTCGMQISEAIRESRHDELEISASHIEL